MSERVQLHVGTYARSGGKGLYPVTLERDGALEVGEPLPAAGNASFAAAGGGGLHYLVDEATGQLGLWRRSGGRWDELGRVRTLGEQPCYVALDEANARLAVANYGSGSVALFALDGAGAPVEPPSLHVNEGRGPVADRQEGPHAHCVRFDPRGGALYTVDLGIDAIVRLAITSDGQLADPRIAYRAPPGTGPRHLLFHPRAPLAVLLSELDSTLTILRMADAALEESVRHSLLPGDFAGDTLGGHLTLSERGDRIYATNRGHDSVAVFDLSPDGTAELLGHVPSGGRGPRHLLLLEDIGLMLVAHEENGRLVAFRLGDGLPEPLGQGVTVPGACFVLRTPE